jgi:hypothetical protein
LERDIVDERQVEDLLKRCRPAGPPDSLRERCLAPPRLAPVWPWATAAAALLAIAIGLQSAVATAMAGANIPPAMDTSAQAAAVMAEALGGDEAARQAAERFIDQEMRRDREQVSRSAPLTGELP